MISSRRYKTSRLTSTRLTPNGSTSAALRQKRPTKVGVKGGLDGLLTPRRVATAATIPPQVSTGNDCSSDPQQDLPLPLENNDDEPNQPAPLQPVAPAALPQSQQELPAVSAHQTHSGRVIKNTPRYDQSISLHNQGLVTWELLLDQDEQEDSPMADLQFATQKALEDLIAYAATDNPDILIGTRR